MKVVQSFWAGPVSQPPGPGAASIAGLSAGWLSPEYHWMSWALSALQAKKIFGAVHLVTDTVGREMLIDRMELPYDSVSTQLDDLPAYPAGLWSMAKIYVYSIQQEPFLHLDGDVFLWQRPRDEFLTAGVVAQNPEKDLSFYRTVLDDINKVFPYIPSPFCKADYAGRSIYSANAGFFGGADLAFIQDYCRQAFSFIEKNISVLPSVDASQLNFIYEQYLLYQYAVARGKQIVFYHDTVVEDPLYKDYVRFQDIPAVPLIHPVGGFKKMTFVCQHIARYLRYEYPSAYYRIIDTMLTEGIAISSQVYYYAGMVCVRNEGFTKVGVRKDCFTDEELHELPELYAEDVRTYRATRELFSLPEDQLWKKTVEKHPAARLEERHWKLTEGFAEEGDFPVMLIPDFLNCNISEYELETIEMLILDTCDSPALLTAILQDMQQYFDAAELSINYEAYKGLIRDCIKRLLYANTLRVKE